MQLKFLNKTFLSDQYIQKNGDPTYIRNDNGDILELVYSGGKSYDDSSEVYYGGWNHDSDITNINNELNILYNTRSSIEYSLEYIKRTHVDKDDNVDKLIDSFEKMLDVIDEYIKDKKLKIQPQVKDTINVRDHINEHTKDGNNILKFVFSSNGLIAFLDEYKASTETLFIINKIPSETFDILNELESIAKDKTSVRRIIAYLTIISKFIQSKERLVELIYTSNNWNLDRIITELHEHDNIIRDSVKKLNYQESEYVNFRNNEIKENSNIRNIFDNFENTLVTFPLKDIYRHASQINESIEPIFKELETDT